jgi:mRNA-degrading endonuclease RelE of RelBE toxin-antitoxin system
MTSVFGVLTARHFERELKKLSRTRRAVAEELETILPILRADPYNRTRQFPIKKLEGVRPGDGQYRIRMRRFRLRYDIEGNIVFLKACSLRREDTY